MKMKPRFALTIAALLAGAAVCAQAAPAAPVKEPTPQPNYKEQKSLTNGKNVGQHLNNLVGRALGRPAAPPPPPPPPTPPTPPKDVYKSSGY